MHPGIHMYERAEKVRREELYREAALARLHRQARQENTGNRRRGQALRQIGVVLLAALHKRIQADTAVPVDAAACLAAQSQDGATHTATGPGRCTY